MAISSTDLTMTTVVQAIGVEGSAQSLLGRRLVTVEGYLPRSVNEVAVSRKAAERVGASVGSKIVFSGGKVLTVVGIVLSPSLALSCGC
ncbi:hypothetical protein ABIB25_001261 [Nakamurella sp. UYEF19]